MRHEMTPRLQRRGLRGTGMPLPTLPDEILVAIAKYLEPHDPSLGAFRMLGPRTLKLQVARHRPIECRLCAALPRVRGVTNVFKVLPNLEALVVPQDAISRFRHSRVQSQRSIDHVNATIDFLAQHTGAQVVERLDLE